MNKESLDKLMNAGKNCIYYNVNGNFKDCESVIVKTIFPPSDDGIIKARIGFAGKERRGQEVVPISNLFAISSDGSLTK